jgi:uncharacterized membrane protein YvbJ
LKYCRECGSELKKGASFCKECGTPVNQPVQENELNGSPTESTEQKSSRKQTRTATDPVQKPKQPLFQSKKSKVAAIAGVVLVALLAVAYIAIDRLITSPTAVADSFISAVQEKDVEKVREHLNEGQLEMDVSSEDAAAFVEHLNSYPRLITEISEQLESDVEAFEKESRPNMAGDQEALATMSVDGKKWLFFDRYVIQVRPVYVDVTSTEDETKIYLNDQEAGEVGSAAPEMIGPILPGQYEVKAVVQGPYGDVEKTQQVDFLSSDEIRTTEAFLDFNFAEHYFIIYSDNDDAFVYVNDENTEKQVKDFTNLGPLPLDGSVQVYAEKEFATSVHKSDTFTVDEDTYRLDLYLGYTDFDEENDRRRAEREEIEKMEGEAADVAETIYSHYSHITNSQYDAAYNLFSSNMQNKFEVDSWADGLEATLLDDVTTVEVKSVSDNEAVAYIEMTSYDEQDDGSVLVQEWEGDWSLVKENGTWKMDSTELEKVDSWTEG